MTILCDICGEKKPTYAIPKKKSIGGVGYYCTECKNSMDEIWFGNRPD